MKNYKIVASDLDGTLLNSQSQISRENMQAIAELTRRGIQFVPASGRTLSELHPQIRSNPDIRYYIYSNGAEVGTTFKYGGKFENQTEKTRVKEFMDKVKSIR